MTLAIKENNIDFKKLPDVNYDDLVGSSSGTIYGTSGE